MDASRETRTSRFAGSVRQLPLLLAAMCILWAGCGDDGLPPIGKVSGHVTVNGAPLAGGMVTFSPEGGGRQSCGTTDKNGYYSLRYNSQVMGALVGKCGVRIGSQFESNTSGVDQSVFGGYDQYEGRDHLLVEVADGSNDIDLPLTKSIQPVRKK